MNDILATRYATARKTLEGQGFWVSPGSWIDGEIGRYYVCSTETVGQYAHPRREICGNEKSEWIAS